MSDVTGRLAYDLKHDRKVAIKVLRPELGTSLASDRFLQEIRLAAKLQHPHIVGLLDSGVIPASVGADAISYYVMPFIRATQGMRDAFWFQGMQCGMKAAVDCIKAFSETDFTEDLKKFDIPTLILHGDDDQNATLKVYPGAPHGLMDTHRDEINADLLAFLKA